MSARTLPLWYACTPSVLSSACSKPNVPDPTKYRYNYGSQFYNSVKVSKTCVYSQDMHTPTTRFLTLT